MGAPSAGSLRPGLVTSTPENRQFSNGTDHAGGGGAVPGDRRSAAGFFQAAG
jgi:hypothetical protein